MINKSLITLSLIIISGCGQNFNEGSQVYDFDQISTFDYINFNNQLFFNNKMGIVI